MTRMSSKRQRFKGILAGYRSGLEEKVAQELKDLGVEAEYEPKDGKIHYVQPEQHRKYTPDFILPNGIIIETKGVFNSDDRKKHLLIKEQHPEKDIRFVFSGNPEKKYLTKSKATSYADWCRKNGFLFASNSIPLEWIKEED